MPPARGVRPRHALHGSLALPGRQRRLGSEQGEPLREPAGPRFVRSFAPKCFLGR